MTYHIIRTLWKLMSLLPMGILHLLSNLIYFPLYYIARYRRKVVRKNLVNAFPEKTEKEIKKIEKDFYASRCAYVNGKTDEHESYKDKETLALRRHRRGRAFGFSRGTFMRSVHGAYIQLGICHFATFTFQRS